MKLVDEEGAKFLMEEGRTHFLVIAPLDGVTRPLESTPAPESRTGMSSRSDFDPGFLTRVPEQVPIPEEFKRQGRSSAAQGVAIEECEKIESFGVTIVRLICSVDTSVLFNLEVRALEQSLADAARAVARDVSPEKKMYWPSRTLLSRTGAECIEDWSMHPDNDVSLSIPSRDKKYITVGWGNNTIESANDLPGQELSDYVAGATDAQVIWARAQHLSDQAQDSLINLLSDPDDLSKNGEFLKVARNYRYELAFQNALSDQLMSLIQGDRKLVAEAFLKSWEYEKFFSRVSERISDVESIATANSELRRRKYQRGVETLLYALGGLAIIQTALDFIQTAFSNYTKVPGREDTRISILEFFRTANVDLILVIVSGLTMLAIFFLVLNGRRGLGK